MVLAGSVLFSFYAAVAGFAFLVWGFDIWPLVAVGTVLFAVFQYKFGKWMALRSVGAEDLSESDAPEIHSMVEELCREMGLDEKPRIMHASMGMPNAFAVGRKAAGTVVISDELIQILDKDELEGVIAHELAHINNRDVVMMVIGQSIASLVGIAVQWVVLILSERNIAAYFLAILAGTIAQMLVMIFVLAISRYREYVADSDAATAIGTGDPLADALEKISEFSESQDVNTNDSVSALCIYGASGSLIRKVFSTHPSTEKRIAKLRSH